MVLVDGDVLAGDIFQDALVGSRSAANVVLGLQAVDGHDDVQGGRDWPSQGSFCETRW